MPESSHMQVKNKYLKESKLNPRRMSEAMSGAAPNLESLRENAQFLKQDDPAAGSQTQGGGASGSAAHAAGSASGVAAAAKARPTAAAKAKAGARRDSDDEHDSILDAEEVDQTLRDFLY